MISLDPIDIAVSSAKTFVLILHTIFHDGTVHSDRLEPYTQEACEEAAMGFEAVGRLTIHNMVEGNEELVIRTIAICLPGPDAGRQLSPVIRSVPKRR